LTDEMMITSLQRIALRCGMTSYLEAGIVSSQNASGDRSRVNSNSQSQIAGIGAEFDLRRRDQHNSTPL
jgi:hypothetical protein